MLFTGAWIRRRDIFLYFFALAPGGVAVSILADPDVAEVVFGVGNYNDDLAGGGVLVNTGRNVPEAEPKVRCGVPCPDGACDGRLRRALPARRGRRSFFF